MLRIIFVTAFFIFSCLYTFAQNTTGAISGKITDSLHHPLEGATVLLVSGAKNTPVKTALSDDKGSFSLEKIKFGTYKLIISMTGFSKYQDTTIIINQEIN